MNINKQTLHKKVFNRMESEVPQSRAHLGGYHTGKRDAYLNVIADLQTGEFDSSSDDRLRSLLEENERITKERDFYKEDRDRCERLERKAHEQLREVREELEQVKKERDTFKRRTENAVKFSVDISEHDSLRSELAAKDKVLGWYAQGSPEKMFWETYEVVNDGGDRARSILEQFARSASDSTEIAQAKPEAEQ